MPRFPTHSISDAPETARPILEQFKERMGKVPNILGAMANNPAALDFYGQANEALGKGVLTNATREAIALAVGCSNSCEYCVSAHGAMARLLGSDEAEVERNMLGSSQDPHTAVLVAFARAISDKQGWAGEDLDDAREHGANDEELIEVIALVAVNIFTNYFNHINETVLDFPKVDLPE